MNERAPLTLNIELRLHAFTLAINQQLTERVTGFFGPSGCGKTSLLESIAGITPSVRGRIAFGDEVWLDSDAGILIPPHHRGIGYVPQAGLLFPHLTVEKNLRFGSRRRPANDHVSLAAGTPLVDEVVRMLELKPLLQRKPRSLSGGERQRVALGRALCSAPRLLLLDEPLSALDTNLRYSILPFLHRVRNEFALPMIWVSHDALEVQSLCDELIVMRDGRSIDRGRPVDLLTDPTVRAPDDQFGFQNTLRCNVVTSTLDETVVSLGSGESAVSLSIANAGTVGQPGTPALVTVPARSILIATQRPTAISARNVLPGTVVKQHPIDGAVLLSIELAPDADPLAVEITSWTQRTLNINDGDRVFVLIKSTACVLL